MMNAKKIGKFAAMAAVVVMVGSTAAMAEYPTWVMPKEEEEELSKKMDLNMETTLGEGIISRKVKVLDEVKKIRKACVRSLISESNGIIFRSHDGKQIAYNFVDKDSLDKYGESKALASKGKIVYRVWGYVGQNVNAECAQINEELRIFGESVLQGPKIICTKPQKKAEEPKPEVTSEKLETLSKSNKFRKIFETDGGGTNFKRISNGDMVKSAESVSNVLYIYDKYLIHTRTIANYDKDRYFPSLTIFDSETGLTFTPISEEPLNTNKDIPLEYWPRIKKGSRIIIGLTTAYRDNKSYGEYNQLLAKHGEALADFHEAAIKEDKNKLQEINEKLAQIEIPDSLMTNYNSKTDKFEINGIIIRKKNYGGIIHQAMNNGLVTGLGLGGPKISQVIVTRVPELDSDNSANVFYLENDYKNAVEGVFELAEKFRNPELQNAIARAIELQGSVWKQQKEN